MRPGIRPRSRPRPNRKARRLITHGIRLDNKYRYFLSFPQADGSFLNTEIYPEPPGFGVDYPPNDWMCGIRGPYATTLPVDDMGFGPLYEMRKAAREAPLFPMLRHQGLQIMQPPNIFRPSEPLGLFMDQKPRPRGSIMQEKLLEEEARRHFPLADTASQAAYVAKSIEAADEHAVERKREQAKRDGFDDYCQAHDLPYMDECPECANLIQPTDNPPENETPPAE